MGAGKRTAGLVSGRDPDPYQVAGGGFEIINGPQSWNRPLYGALLPDGLNRFKVIAGDRPRLLLLTPGLGGQVFFACGLGDRLLKAESMARIKALYRDGRMEYELSDPRLGAGSMHLSIVPALDYPGLVIRASFKDLPTACRFFIFYRGGDHSKDARGFDAGYTPETRIQFDRQQSAADFGLDVRSSATGQVLQVEAEAFAAGELRVIGGQAQTSVAELSGVLFPAAAGARDAWCAIGSDLPPAVEPADLWHRAGQGLVEITSQARFELPDTLLAAAARALPIALNASWIAPFQVHGAWSWNIPLLGWRVRYGSTVLAWHERVREEASWYLASQYDASMRPRGAGGNEPDASALGSLDSAYFGFENPTAESGGSAGTGPASDPAWRHARQGSNSIFVSEGMIPYMPGKGRTVIYNMQEVFFDQLIHQCRWTGNQDFIRQILPALESHLAWETRCFDGDGDGLYENFANFWASDGIYYAGAGCLLASAYNFSAHRICAELREAIGLDGGPHRAEAQRIRQAVQDILWLKDKGHPAESRDSLGARLLHPSLSLPSVVHAAESEIFDQFELFQTLRYVERNLEHLPSGNGYLVWSSNWVPYRWSVREIDFADQLHLALAYHKNGQSERAWKLMQGAIHASCCDNVSPGGFMCVLEGKSIDFSDCSSMFARVLVEGLFGIHPNLHKAELELRPEFPLAWERASFSSSDFDLDWRCADGLESLDFRSRVAAAFTIRLKARQERIVQVLVDGALANHVIEAGMGHACIVLRLPRMTSFSLEISYDGSASALPQFAAAVLPGQTARLDLGGGTGLEVHDPRSVLEDYRYEANKLFFTTRRFNDDSLFFLRLRIGELESWVPVELMLQAAPAAEVAEARFVFDLGAVTRSAGRFEPIDIDRFFNRRFVDLFADVYHSPRSPWCSLQLPTTLYPPNWSVIDQTSIAGMHDDELRQHCAAAGGLFTVQGIPFRQTAQEAVDTLFVSHWDCFPTRWTVPLALIGGQLFLLFTGWTNQMQCQVVNARISLAYANGTKDVLELVHPDNFRSIEAGPGSERSVDAFCYGPLRLTRVLIGRKSRHPAVPGDDDGLYAQVLTCKLRGDKLISLELEAVANEVLIGLMAITHQT